MRHWSISREVMTSAASAPSRSSVGARALAMTTACAARPPPGRGHGHKVARGGPAAFSRRGQRSGANPVAPAPTDNRTAGATGTGAACWWASLLGSCQLPVVVSMTFNAPVVAASPKTS